TAFAQKVDYQSASPLMVRYKVFVWGSQSSVISYQLSVISYQLWLFGLFYAKDRITRDETLIEKDIWRFLSIVFYLELANQLSLLPDKDLVDLRHQIKTY
ncbi:MAG: hypothetical protein ACKO90_10530, partial [Microcystis panniformis]